MAEVNFNELFGSFSAADALAATETNNTSSFSGRADLYKPSIKDEKCTDQNYRALVRFIPFFHEGKWRTTVITGVGNVHAVSPTVPHGPLRTDAVGTALGGLVGAL